MKTVFFSCALGMLLAHPSSDQGEPDKAENYSATGLYEIIFPLRSDLF